MVSEGDHPKLVTFDVVDDAIGKPAQRETTPVSPPGCTELRMCTEKIESPLELRDESKP